MNRSETIGIASGAIGTASVLIGYLLEAIRQRGDCDLGNKSPDTLGISVLLIVVIGGLAGITGIVAALIGARHLRITQALRNTHRVRSGVILRERSDTGVIEVPFTAEVIAIARVELLCCSCHAAGTLQADTSIVKAKSGAHAIDCTDSSAGMCCSVRSAPCGCVVRRERRRRDCRQHHYCGEHDNERHTVESHGTRVVKAVTHCRGDR
jgi:hypothetical protein